MASNSKKRSAEEFDISQPAASQVPQTKKSSPVAGPSWSLGKVRNGERYAYVDEFRGATLISFREFYSADDGQLKPGNKGISLSMEQFKALRECWDELCEEVDKKA